MRRTSGCCGFRPAIGCVRARRRSPRASRTAPHVRYAESVAAGLVDTADELGASLIVVGAADGGNRGRHRLGTTTAELVHSSDVPSRSSRAVHGGCPPTTDITRLTAAVVIVRAPSCSSRRRSAWLR
ncbi:MAG: universal stress protein [Microbacterium arborescens]